MIKEYECPYCGGTVEWDSRSQKLKCPFCDSTFEVSDFETSDYQADVDQTQTESGMYVYSCNSCGGEVVSANTTGSMKCPFCDNNLVRAEVFSGKDAPNYVIPFKLDKRQAQEKFKEFVESGPLTPDKFKREARATDIQGVYLPFWVYRGSAQGMGYYSATKVRHWSDSNYEYTETSHYHVERGGVLDFDNLPVNCSTKVDSDVTESLEPFNIKEAQPFNTGYLSGYGAEKFNMTERECQDTASRRLDKSVENALRNDIIGYTAVTPLGKPNTTPQYKNRTYTLYPVWLMNVNYEGKKLRFAMNGQTGKFVGDVPTDAGKVFKKAVLPAIIVFIVLALIGVIFL